MSEDSVRRSLAEIRSLRSKGLISAQDAYELHMQALSVAVPPAAVVTPAAPVAPTAKAPATVWSRVTWDVIAITMAVLGGVFGVIGAVFQEIQSGGGILLVFTGAPLIEEAMKPAGIYILLAVWPQALRGQVHTAALTALSGLCFGLIESFVYVTLYFPEGDADFVLFRFTVPVAMHAIASFIVGLGLSRVLIEWTAGRGPFPKRLRNFYLAAVGLHAVYNVAAVVLSLSGVLDFE